LRIDPSIVRGDLEVAARINESLVAAGGAWAQWQRGRRDDLSAGIWAGVRW
jgi:hypothetical protein